jgi:hypothetical protein
MKTKPLLIKNGYVLVDVQFATDDLHRSDVIFICSHGYHDGAFLAAFPQIAKAYEHIPHDLFQQYLRLEYDFAARDLAMATMTHVPPSMNASIVRIHYHRGIVDANRRSNFAVRKIFDEERFPEVKEYLQDICLASENSIMQFFRDQLSPNGFLFDFHSMWPTSQHISPTDFEAHDRVEHYVKAILDDKNQSHVRSINAIVSSTRERNIADMQRTQTIINTLHHHGFPVEVDHPYNMSDAHAGTYYARNFPTVVFDTPRSFLGSMIDPTQPTIWQKDHKKIDRLAHLFAEGVVAAQQRHFDDD